MNYSEQPLGNSAHDSIAATVNHHYFEVRDENESNSQIRRQIDELQATVLSQIALEFRTLHERLDTLENRLSQISGPSSISAPHTRISGLETKLWETLASHASQVSAQEEVSNSCISQNLVPTSNNHLTTTSPRRIQPPVTVKKTSHTDLTSVSQLPSEESAKVKVLLRQFAAQTMNYIEKNAASYTNVNNNVGAITTMKKFDIYETTAWDRFVEVNFPHVQKADLRDELVKIVSVKVKNIKARFKKRLSESHSMHRGLQQPHSHPAQQHLEQAQRQSPQLSDTMSDIQGIMTPPMKRLCTGTLPNMKGSSITQPQTSHQVYTRVFRYSVSMKVNRLVCRVARS